jgi:hypothetical protein
MELLPSGVSREKRRIQLLRLRIRGAAIGVVIRCNHLETGKNEESHGEKIF